MICPIISMTFYEPKRALEKTFLISTQWNEETRNVFHIEPYKRNSSSTDHIKKGFSCWPNVSSHDCLHHIKAGKQILIHLFSQVGDKIYLQYLYNLSQESMWGLKKQWNGDKGQIDLNNSWEKAKQQVEQLFFFLSPVTFRFVEEIFSRRRGNLSAKNKMTKTKTIVWWKKSEQLIFLIQLKFFLLCWN